MPRPCVSHRLLHVRFGVGFRVKPGAGRAGAAAALAAGLLLLAACSSPPTRPPSPTQALASASSERGARALQRGDWPLALTQYQATLQAAVALQDPALTGNALLGLSVVQARLGDLAQANSAADQILARPGYFDAGQQARAAARKAVLALDGPQPADTLRWADRAEALCTAPCALAPLLGNLRAHAALLRGDAAAAATLAEAAARAAESTGQDGEWASALRLQARGLSQLAQSGQSGQPSQPSQPSQSGQPDQAERAATLLAQALQIDRRLGQPDRVALDLLLAAEVEDQRGRRDTATELLQRALAVYSASGHAKQADAVRLRLAGR